MSDSSSAPPPDALLPAASSEASAAANRQTTNPAMDSFAVYLAKRLMGDKGFQLGVPEEARALVEQSHLVLSYGDFGLAIACILDREKEPHRTFTASQEELVGVARACLKYTGTMNGAKMPVGVTLYEVGAGPPSEEDCQRLRALQRTFPGLTKVAITCFYLDTRSQKVWSSAPLPSLLSRIGHRGWVAQVLAEGRKSDLEIFVPEPVLPQKERLPVATAALLLLLLAMFGIEHSLKLTDGGTGLWGVDVATLFALGGMNRDAVLTHGQWYRLLSAALLHGDAFHLILNGVSLGLAGYLLESLLGRAWFLSLFLIGSLGGSLLGLLVNDDNVVSIGASGAVMGLLAAALVVSMRFPRGSTRTTIQVQLMQFLIPSLIPLTTHRQGGKIDFAAHFGGALVGLFAGYLLMKIWPSKEEAPRFPRLAQALAVGSVLLFALSLWQVKEFYPLWAASIGQH